jgi:tRNA modification GTPase
MDTIFALASGRGRAGVAVIRVSGPAAHESLTAFGVLAGQARQARLVRLIDPATREVIDQALVLCFEHGASFTGEAVVEFQLHGSGAVVKQVERILCALPEYRRAEPGEFTRRAFENGRIDLTQVEALGDLIDSDTEHQRRYAMRRLEGAGGRLVGEWRGMLIGLRAMVAGLVDFSDEGDVVDELPGEFDSVLQRLCDGLRSALAGRRAGRILRDGYRVALLGRPNSGKSKLLNALSGSDSAIVSDIAGTTRDVLEARIDVDGWPVILQDMAGVREETTDLIEQIGIARAWERARSADLVLVLQAADVEPSLRDLGPSDVGCDVLHVRTKCDLDEGRIVKSSCVSVSAVTGEGLDSLRAAIGRRLAEASEILERSGTGSERHFDLIEVALARCAEVASARTKGIEFVDHALLRVDHVLGRIVGHISVDDVLDDVFSRFCIGK